jgi:hypothetical protein
LQQVWFSQLASTLMRSSNLLQVVPSDLSKLVIHKLAASWWNNLHQVCKCQLASDLIDQLAASLMNASGLMQVEKIRLDATWYPQTWCKLMNLFTQFAGSRLCLWNISFHSDKQTQ